MRSPFAVFRKHAKVLTVVLTGLAMFAFIIMDQLRPENFPAVVGFILGVSLFWFLGRQSHQPVSFALVGGALGLILGIYLPGLAGPSAAVSTSAGSLSAKELQDRRRRRQVANQFIQEAYALTRDPKSFSRPPQTFNYGSGPEQDTVLIYLLQREADSLGIAISDEAVNRFIDQMTNGKLSRKDYGKVRTRMRISETELYNVLREQLRARLALILSTPRILPTPDQYWQLYRRLKVKQTLDATAIPVDAFLDTVPKPSDSELADYFEARKRFVNNQQGAGEFGFRQPRRFRVASLEARYVTVEASVGPVTDQHIKDYYEAHKETLFNNRPLPDSAGTPASPPTNPDGSTPPVTAPKPSPSAGTTGDKSGPKLSQPAGSKSKSPKSKPPGPSNPQPKNSPSTKSKKKKATSQTQPSDIETQDVFTFNQDKKSAAKKQKPQTNTANKSAAGKKPAARQQSAKSAGKKPAAAPSGKPTKGAGKPTKETAQNSAPVTAPKPTSYKPLPKYKPLSEVRGEIRDRLLRERTLAAMKTKIEAASQFMYDLGYQRTILQNDKKKRLSSEEMSRRLKAYATKSGLVLAETPLVSTRDLEDYEKYPIGSATEPVENPTQRSQATTVSGELLNSQPDQLYTVARAEDPVTNNLFVYWKSEDVAAHVPTLDEPGVSEEVLLAWKTEQARKPALERAKALAKSVQTSGKSIDVIFAGQTVSGKKTDQRQLVVIRTPSFSWLRTSSAPQPDNPFGMPRPTVSTVIGIDRVGEEFMRFVFDDLRPGDVEVVPNADRSIYYIVQIASRIPSDAPGEQALRQSFLAEDKSSFLSPYFYLLRQTQMLANSRWRETLQKKYDVHWNQDYLNQMQQR